MGGGRSGSFFKSYQSAPPLEFVWIFWEYTFCFLDLLPLEVCNCFFFFFFVNHSHVLVDSLRIFSVKKQKQNKNKTKIIVLIYELLILINSFIWNRCKFSHNWFLKFARLKQSETLLYVLLWVFVKQDHLLMIASSITIRGNLKI